MKRTFIAIAIVGTMAFTACQKDLSGDRPVDEAVMTVKVNDAMSKALGVTETNEGTINNYDVFVFNASTGVIDGYKSESSNASLSLTATSGPKHVYVVANRQAGFDVTSVRSEANFLSKTASMMKENSSSFTMIGETDCTLSSSQTNTVEVDVTRFVAKIALTSLAVNFTGTPLAGQTLSNVKIYLKNVPALKLFSGSDVTSPQYLSGNTSAWQTGALNAGILSDQVNSIADGSATANPSFYPYSRWSASAMAANACIRLVITADIDGDNDGTPENYTWSIPINGS
ncbi:MAG: hypothetical protein J6Z27_00035, partial [Bacteroidales bacterium]|nr:hypothetical protein [Bacteroidales bacterium]